MTSVTRQLFVCQLGTAQKALLRRHWDSVVLRVAAELALMGKRQSAPMSRYISCFPLVAVPVSTVSIFIVKFSFVLSSLLASLCDITQNLMGSADLKIISFSYGRSFR